MIYVSIDIAKLNHFASLISSDNEILVEPFQFSNDDNGFQYLVSAFKSFDDKEIIIGLESTAHYADNLIRYGFSSLFWCFSSFSWCFLQFHQLFPKNFLFLRCRTKASCFSGVHQLL